MPTITVTKNWLDGTVLTESQLDDIKNSVETFLNVTKIDSDNIQTGGVNTNSLASNSVTAAKIIAEAVTTAKLANDAVTALKIATAVAGDGLAGGGGTALSVNVDGTGIEISSDTLQLKDLGVVTAKINALAVTRAKQEAVGQQISSTMGSFTSSSGNQDVPNATVTITTTGRPVLISFQPQNPSVSTQGSGATGLSQTNELRLFRDAVIIGNFGENAASFVTVDVVVAGTYTYKFNSRTAGQTIRFLQVLAYEL